MKRWVALLAFVSVTAATSLAMAQEIQLRGPLAGAPSCRHCVLYRSGRLSVAPTFGITLQDDFDRAMLVGLQINFHVVDIFAIGVWGAYAVAHIPTSLTNQITTQLTPAPGQSRAPLMSANIPVGEHFPQQIGQIQWMLAVPQLTLIPLRGKLALFQNIFIDTDFYIFAGLGIIGFNERAQFDAGAAGGCNTTGCRQLNGSEPDIVTNQTTRASQIAFTGMFGAGLNFYLANFLSLAIEYRAFPFAWNTSGTDESTTAMSCGVTGMGSCAGSPDYSVQRDAMGNGGRFTIDATDRAVHFNQMINFSINVFLPPSPHRGD